MTGNGLYEWWPGLWEAVHDETRASPFRLSKLLLWTMIGRGVIVLARVLTVGEGVVGEGWSGKPCFG